jgi:hypothetical protein
VGVRLLMPDEAAIIGETHFLDLHELWRELMRRQIMIWNGLCGEGVLVVYR